MKQQLYKGVGAAILAAVMVVLSVPGEAAEVRWAIPFSFEVSDVTLPPGNYSVSMVQSTLSIRGATRGAFALSSNLDSRDATTPKLVFHRYGDAYILRQVWTGGSSGRQLPRSHRERQLANASRRGEVATFERIVIPIS